MLVSLLMCGTADGRWTGCHIHSYFYDISNTLASIFTPSLRCKVLLSVARTPLGHLYVPICAISPFAWLAMATYFHQFCRIHLMVSIVDDGPTTSLVQPHFRLRKAGSTPRRPFRKATFSTAIKLTRRSSHTSFSDGTSGINRAKCVHSPLARSEPHPAGPPPCGPPGARGQGPVEGRDLVVLGAAERRRGRAVIRRPAGRGRVGGGDGVGPRRLAAMSAAGRGIRPGGPAFRAGGRGDQWTGGGGHGLRGAISGGGGSHQHG